MRTCRKELRPLASYVNLAKQGRPELAYVNARLDGRKELAEMLVRKYQHSSGLMISQEAAEEMARPYMEDALEDRYVQRQVSFEKAAHKLGWIGF